MDQNQIEQLNRLISNIDANIFSLKRLVRQFSSPVDNLDRGSTLPPVPTHRNDYLSEDPNLSNPMPNRDIMANPPVPPLPRPNPVPSSDNMSGTPLTNSLPPQRTPYAMGNNIPPRPLSQRIPPPAPNPTVSQVQNPVYPNDMPPQDTNMPFDNGLPNYPSRPAQRSFIPAPVNPMNANIAQPPAQPAPLPEVDPATAPGVEGKFDGTHLVSDSGEKIEVPSTYASKTRILFGDVVKMYEDKGEKKFKVMNKQTRKKLTAIATKKEGKWYALTGIGAYKISDSFADFSKLNLNDELTVLVPEDNLSVPFAAIDEVVKPANTPKQDSSNEQPKEKKNSKMVEEYDLV